MNIKLYTTLVAFGLAMHLTGIASSSINRVCGDANGEILCALHTPLFVAIFMLCLWVSYKSIERRK